MLPDGVIVMPQYRVTQGSIGIVQFDELPVASFWVRTGIGVDLARFSAKGLFDLLRVGLGSNAQKTVVIDSGTGSLNDSEGLRSGCEFFLETVRVQTVVTTTVDKGSRKLHTGLGARRDNGAAKPQVIDISGDQHDQ
jgi:hypothetical protein